MPAGCHVLEGFQIVMGTAGAAVEDDQWGLAAVEVAGHAIPRLVTAKGCIALAGLFDEFHFRPCHQKLVGYTIV